ncbi:hypothetical protein [Flavobacterium sp.]|uniref:hypothetical protein n=1 Tax=Flavobacterium sp. TaxID=239 RepID=UPI002622C64B|nr:hypothetical protein [Flavobacterium sp.]
MTRNLLLVVKIILPIIVGILFYFFVLLGMNYRIISKDSSFSLCAIGLGAILLYVIVFGIINNKENISLGLIGIAIARILFVIVFPLFMVNHFKINDTNKSESLLEKQQIELNLNPSKCYEIKYGLFAKGSDTIERYKTDNEDFERIKSLNGEQLFKIKWMDSSMYIRINPENNLVEETVTIGNFNNGKHEIYVTPIGTHSERSEKLEYAYEIKNNR